MPRPWIPLLVCSLAAACGGAASDSAGLGPGVRLDADVRYRIVLERPSIVGRKEKLTITATSERAVRRTDVATGSEGAPEVSRTVTSFEGLAAPRALDERGRVVAVDYLVGRFTEDAGRGPVVVLPPGKGISVRRARGPGSAEIVVSGDGLLAPETRAAIEAVLETTTSHGSDDDLFGTPIPQAIGATWSVNGAALQRELAEAAIVPGAALGSVRLLAQRDYGTTPCLDIAMEATASGWRPPDVLAVERSETRFRSRGLYPLYLDALPPFHESHTSSEVVARDASGRVRIAIAISQRKVTQRSLE